MISPIIFQVETIAQECSGTLGREKGRNKERREEGRMNERRKAQEGRQRGKKERKDFKVSYYHLCRILLSTQNIHYSVRKVCTGCVSPEEHQRSSWGLCTTECYENSILYYFFLIFAFFMLAYRIDFKQQVQNPADNVEKPVVKVRTYKQRLKSKSVYINKSSSIISKLYF